VTSVPSSASCLAWLIVDNVPPHRVGEGDVIVVT